MKAILRWLAKVIGSALTIVLVIVLFPHISKLAARFMPDESGAAIKASAILSSRMENSARLETFTVEEDGVLNYDIQAALLGSVANINVSYVYSASFGIALNEVTMQVSGDELTFFLPDVIVLQDSLTPKEVYRDDFWYPGFSDTDYENLLEAERVSRRETYLSGAHREKLWSSAVAAFEQTVSAWLQEIDANLTIRYEAAEQQAVN